MKNLFTTYNEKSLNKLLTKHVSIYKDQLLTLHH